MRYIYRNNYLQPSRVVIYQARIKDWQAPPLLYSRDELNNKRSAGCYSVDIGWALCVQYIDIKQTFII